MELNIDNYKVSISNGNKIFWPDLNISKGDMIDYYIKIYPHIMDYLRNRPLSLKIYPDGIKGKSFYRKNAPDYAPSWLSTTKINSSKKKHINWITINKLVDLIWVANHGSIELHNWFSTIESPQKPDFAVFDLDPGKNTTLEILIEITLLLKEILDQLNLKSYIKTSGKRGLHVYIPLIKKYNYSEVKSFLKKIAKIIIDLKPDLTTIEWRKEKRQGKLHIDYRQNGRGKTLPAPYSLRPTPKCTVSTPLNWNQITPSLNPEDFTINTIWNQLQSNPWLDLFENKQYLPPL